MKVFLARSTLHGHHQCRWAYRRSTRQRPAGIIVHSEFAEQEFIEHGRGSEAVLYLWAQYVGTLV